jgi:ribosomal protein L40E
MVRVHAARTLAEAELVRQTLAGAGHHVELRGLARVGLAGEIPFPDAVVEVWVEASGAEAARACLASVEARAHLEWVCPGCGERNPASFEHCWSCEGAPA